METMLYKNVYLNEVSTIAGPYEKKGPLGSYFDKTYDEFYFHKKTWEQAESKLIEESIDLVLRKLNKTRFDIDVHIGGDLLNQIVASNYAASRLKIPFLGIYSACATSMEGMIIGANLVEAKLVKNCLVTTSSHNNAAEKQFRYPVEYGAVKKKTTTFTVTGGTCAYLSREKSMIKIDSATIGTVEDMGEKDVMNMGAVMTPAAASTIYKHLKNTKRNISYYDLILTGDLGIYGEKMLKEFMEVEYRLKLKNYKDAGTMIYDLDNQPVFAGGSGPACAPLVAFSYVLEQMKKKELKHVLVVATGALFSPTMTNQKLSIPSIAHAISLEVVQ